MPELVATQKSFIAGSIVSLPTPDFVTTSTSFVSVTGVTLSIPDSMTVGVSFEAVASSNIGEAKLILGADESPIITVNTIKQFVASILLKNATGSAQTATVEIKRVAPAVMVTIFENTLVLAYAERTNETDSFEKISMSQVKMFNFSGTRKGFNGILSDWEALDMLVEDVKAIIPRVIWNDNNATVIWTWSGTSLEISA